MDDIKSIIVFGATGITGLQMVKMGIAKGLQVTAFVRSPEKIPEDVRAKLHKIVRGDILDAKQVEDAIEGQDAVLSAIGSKIVFLSEVMVLTTGCTNIVSGMKKHNVKKLVVISGAAMMPNPGFFLGLINTRGSFADHRRQLDILEKEEEFLDWIAILPPRIRDSEVVNTEYQVKVDETPGIFECTTAEIADFAVTLLQNNKKWDQYLHSKVGISSGPKSSNNTIIKVAVTIAVIGVLAGTAYKRM